ncbi:hypothetical protein [Endozoicomonas sp. SCSIO W0465]|uniref:hypothetical protein n=1 Tax=Endozoicomonas sp. SCSIO W0465 TaxID=2918516 RepID=UPI002075B66A|nr:hypothetical protein [Endozoicomonas sp. SCSIO W0465]USE36943.1 hypothetical protein MJO57_01485 [Endozoicomonas sp. SCSIO W0465]
MFPEFYLQEDLDAIVPCYSASEPVNNDLTLKNTTLTNSLITAQTPPPEDSFVNFFQPSSSPPPVAAFDPLNNNAQQQVHTKSVEFTAHSEPVTLRFKEVSTCDKRKAIQAKYNASDKGKASSAKRSAKYNASNKGKERRSKYLASEKGKLCIAIINARASAYRSAIKKGFSEEAAREKGESAANAKKAKLASASQPTFASVSRKILPA